MGEAEASGVPMPDSSQQDNEVRDAAEVALDHYPLQYSWTFWFDIPNGKSKQASWGTSLKSLHTFSTVEGFWRGSCGAHIMLTL